MHYLSLSLSLSHSLSFSHTHTHTHTHTYNVLIMYISYIQRIAGSLRRGAAEDIGLEKFVEALKDPSTGLTYPALTGARKQSVEDVERLFGEGVIKFMEQHKYKNEAKYLRTVRNWRRAVDERGLSDTQRQQFCSDFLDYVLKDLIPWYSAENEDFSQLEVNRYMHIIIIIHPHTLSQLQTY